MSETNPKTPDVVTPANIVTPANVVTPTNIVSAPNAATLANVVAPLTLTNAVGPTAQTPSRPATSFYVPAVCSVVLLGLSLYLTKPVPGLEEGHPRAEAKLQSVPAGEPSKAPAASTPAAGKAQQPGVSNLVPYAANVVALLLFLGGLGYYRTGRITGVLIDQRMVYSLSQFQMILWTCVLLPAFVTVAFAAVQSHVFDLNITVDETLWALMGIGTASFVGARLVLASKRDQAPGQDPSKLANSSQLSSDEMKSRQGVLYANSDMEKARFVDIFEGDELGNASFLDVSKIQMFVFTLVASVTYVSALIAMLRDMRPDANGGLSLPTMAQGLVALVGISHAGYVTNKAVDHTNGK